MDKQNNQNIYQDTANNTNNFSNYEFNCDHTIQSTSTLKAVGNYHVDEIIVEKDVNAGTTQALPIKRRNTLSNIPATLINLESLKNKKRRIVIDSKKKNNIFFAAVKQPSVYNEIKRSKTLNSDLGIIPNILTKNEFFSSKTPNYKLETVGNAPMLNKDEMDNKFNYFPDNDPKVNFTNPIKLPVTSTPKKRKKSVYLHEIGSFTDIDTSDFTTISNHIKPKSMGSISSSSRKLTISNTICFKPEKNTKLKKTSSKN